MKRLPRLLMILVAIPVLLTMVLSADLEAREMDRKGKGRFVKEISEAFNEILSREPTPREIKRYSTQLRAGTPLALVKRQLAMTPESRARVAKARKELMGSVSLEEVNKAYHDVLNRPPDLKGLLYWSMEYNNGKGMPIGEIHRHMANSDENKFLIAQAMATDSTLSKDIVEAYRVMLGREPDLKGLKYWSKELAGGMSLHQIRRHFANSQENKDLIAYKLKIDPKLNADVAELYRTILGREPDLPGLEYWSAEVAKGFSLHELTRQMTNADENREVIRDAMAADPSLSKEVAALYREVLGREPDLKGLEYWSKELAKGVSLDEIRGHFLASDEAKERAEPGTPDEPTPPAPAADLSPEVAEAYRLILGREPDEDGWRHYTDRLNGGTSILDIRRELANSEENRKIIEDALAGSDSLEIALVELYQELLHRLPDKAGLEYWSQRLREGMSMEDIRQSFLESDEGKAIAAQTAAEAAGAGSGSAVGASAGDATTSGAQADSTDEGF